MVDGSTSLTLGATAPEPYVHLDSRALVLCNGTGCLMLPAAQFRWARGNTDDSQPATQPTQGGNPFSRFYNAVAGDYIPLRSGEQSNEDEAWFALSRWERCVLQTVDHILANTENAARQDYWALEDV